MKDKKDNKRLYFIPILAKAFERPDSRKAFDEAFDEIRRLGEQPGYEEGFRQFKEFARTAAMPLKGDSGLKTQMMKDVIHGLICDLADDTFEGSEEERETLESAVRSVPEWNAEYDRIRKEVLAFQAPEAPIEVEVLKDGKTLAAWPISPDPLWIGPISPGSYAVQLSNGRVLWEGDVTKEDVIWAFAYPGKDLRMAAETEVHDLEPTRTILLLDGELLMSVFAGLETGRIRFESGEPI